MLHVVLMRNKQITVWAIAARLVEREHLHGIDMDDERQLSLVHLVLTLRTPCPPHILVRIEKEAVTRMLFAKLCRGFLLLIGHSSPHFPWSRVANAQGFRTSIRDLFCLILLSTLVNSCCYSAGW